MPDLTGEYLPKLLSPHPAGINLPGNHTTPDYQGNSLANLPFSICNWLNIPVFGSGGISASWSERINGEFDHVVLILLDGVGLDMFRNAQSSPNSKIDLGTWLDYRERATLVPLTSVVPSTTSSALTSLWTGTPPARHGIVGYEVWLKEFSMIANMITQSPVSFTGEPGAIRRAGFNPEQFLQCPTLGQHLTRNGVQPYAMLHVSISRSGLSTMLMPGVKVIPVRSFTDLVITLEQKVKSEPNGKTYTYIYWGELDDLSHHYGPNDERVHTEFSMIRMQLGNLIDRISAKTRKRYLFILTADHGQISTPKNPGLDLNNHPDFLKNLSMQPSGENRLSYLFIRPGKENTVRDYIYAAWPNLFDIYTGQDFIQSTLLGPGDIHQNLNDRIGDLVIIPRSDNYWWWAKKENHLLGRHGGLSQAEMLVPFNFLVF